MAASEVRTHDEGAANEGPVERHFLPGSLLLTLDTFGREPIFADDRVVHALRVVRLATARATPFETFAYVVLPDHLHLLIKPADGINADAIVHRLTRRFERDYSQMMGLPASQTVLGRHYAMHRVADRADFAHCLDQIHYDPVYHGAAKRPEEWPHSSYESWIERGRYKLGWGWTWPSELQGRHMAH